MNGTWVKILFAGSLGFFSDLHRKMSNRCVCNTAGLIQTSENNCIPDVPAKSLLVFCMQLLSIWDVGICLIADTSGYL